MTPAVANTADRTVPYRQTVDEVAASLGTDVRRGLTEGEARARLNKYGRNELTAEARDPAWRRFLAQFQDVLVILLLIATAISAALWFYERDAALTGESFPVMKDTAKIDEDVALGDRHNLLFSGTAATYGHGVAIVTATGMRTEMGRIAGLMLFQIFNVVNARSDERSAFAHLFTNHWL